jgi:hypothetical protein
MSQAIRKVWTFASDSDPDREYQTLQYTDGSTSCNCKGWTRRIDSDGQRSCKHTRYVDLGVADRNATAFHDYQPPTSTPKSATTHASTQTLERPRLGQRKFSV